MTPAPYDPEEAVAEFEARFRSRTVIGGGGKSSLQIDLEDWVRAALVAAYAAGVRQTWKKAYSCIPEEGEVRYDEIPQNIEHAARADNVEL